MLAQWDQRIMSSWGGGGYGNLPSWVIVRIRWCISHTEVLHVWATFTLFQGWRRSDMSRCMQDPFLKSVQMCAEYHTMWPVMVSHSEDCVQYWIIICELSISKASKACVLLKFGDLSPDLATSYCSFAYTVDLKTQQSLEIPALCLKREIPKLPNDVKHYTKGFPGIRAANNYILSISKAITVCCFKTRDYYWTLTC